MSRRKALSPERSLSRRRPTREPRARFLLLCEGEVTEPEYFRYVKDSLRDYLLVVEISREHGNPLQLVEAAVEKAQSALKNARKDRDDNLRYDRVWCVLDVDNHPQLPAARTLAAKHGISLAISNPCFELWPLLHMVDQRAYISIQGVQTKLRQHMPGYEKRLDCSRLCGSYQLARQRAVAIETQHDRDGKKSSCNPSTDVWRLIDELLAAKERAGGMPFSDPL
jgi:RloB-like protein